MSNTAMKQQIENRLKQLKAELASGNKMLMELKAKEANLQETLLRISGAIQVLEELLQEKPEDTLDSAETIDNGQMSESVVLQQY